MRKSHRSSYRRPHLDHHSPVLMPRKKPLFGRRRAPSPQGGGIRGGRHYPSVAVPLNRGAGVMGDDWKSDCCDGDTLSRHSSNATLGNGNPGCAPAAGSSARDGRGRSYTTGAADSMGGVDVDKPTIPEPSPRVLRRPKSFGGSFGPLRLLRKGTSPDLFSGSASASTPVAEGGASNARSAGGGTPRPHHVWHGLSQLHLHPQREGLEFDLPLVRHGLKRGRIKGRCVLVCASMGRSQSVPGNLNAIGGGHHGAGLDSVELGAGRGFSLRKTVSGRWHRHDVNKLTMMTRVFGPVSATGLRNRITSGTTDWSSDGRQLKRSASAGPEVFRNTRLEREDTIRRRARHEGSCTVM